MQITPKMQTEIVGSDHQRISRWNQVFDRRNCELLLESRKARDKIILLFSPQTWKCHRVRFLRTTHRTKLITFTLRLKTIHPNPLGRHISTLFSNHRKRVLWYQITQRLSIVMKIFTKSKWVSIESSRSYFGHENK